jgi:hypothetical protein
MQCLRQRRDAFGKRIERRRHVGDHFTVSRPEASQRVLRGGPVGGSATYRLAVRACQDVRGSQLARQFLGRLRP